MDENSLAQLIEISHVVGTNREYVQAAGGNTSVKSPDGRTMAIKASGTALTLMSETDGWVEMDVAAVLSGEGARSACPRVLALRRRRRPRAPIG